MNPNGRKKTDVLLSNLPSLSGATGTASTTDKFEEYAIRGMFYRISYNYNDRYMFEANGRYDGTSRFPKTIVSDSSHLSQPAGVSRKKTS